MKTLSIRMDKELHEQLRIKSFKENRSMNEIIIEAIKEKIKRGEK